MKKIILLIIFTLSANLYAQCTDYDNANLCNNDNGCEWIEDFDNLNCTNFSSQTSCENYSSYGCSWEWSWGGWMNSGSSCVGGSFQVDNGECVEVLPECSEMNEIECNNNGDCLWVENVTYGNCGGLSENACDSNPNCYYDCEFYHGSCAGCCYGSCLGGTYEIDNSFCDENISPPENCSDMNELECLLSVECEWLINSCEDINNSTECSEMDEAACNHPLYGDGCEWINGECQDIDDNQEYQCDQLNQNECEEAIDCQWNEDENLSDCSDFNNESQCDDYLGECFWYENIEWSSCSQYTSESSCNAAGGNCYWDCSWWYTWACSCYGGGYVDNSECIGEYTIDNGTCGESEFQLGDVNGDSIINILDIIETIDLVLTSSYNVYADMNNDNTINIADIIIIINFILNEE